MSDITSDFSAWHADAPPSPPALKAETNPRLWGWGLGALPLLAYWVWAGTAADWWHGLPWTWTASGWLVPAPGWAHLWISGTLLLALLSALAFRALRLGNGPRIWNWVFGVGILAIGIATRLVMIRTWAPSPVQAITGWGAIESGGPGIAVAADALTILLLIAETVRAKRCIWLAALYAFHPLAMMESAWNGSWMAWVLPGLLVVVVLSRFLRPWAKGALVAGMAGLAVYDIAIKAGAGAGGGQVFNGLLAFGLDSFSLPLRVQRTSLVGLEMGLQVIVLLLAWRRGWSVARTLGHMGVVWVLVAPAVYPAEVLPMVALIPLAWNRAGWVLSLTSLSAYAIFVMAEPGASTAPLPAWLMVLSLLPAVVLEAHALLAEAVGGRE